MIAREALVAAMSEIVGPVLRAAGFDGSPPTWRRRADTGDWTVVNVEITGADDQPQCVVNLAVVPAPWLEFMGVWLGMPPTDVQESLGLYRDRLTPEGWVLRSPGAAAAVATDVAERLSERGLPVLERLQDRTAMLDALRVGDLGMLKHAQYPGLFAFAEAVLISEDGPSERLDELLATAEGLSTPERKESLARYSFWIRERAKSRGDD